MAWFRGFRGDDPLWIPGITPASLRKFPADTREIARRIEHICGNPALYSKHGDTDADMQLAKDLCAYSDRLEARMKTFRSFLREHPKHYDMQTVSRRKLLGYIHRATGLAHYSWVADILSGAPQRGAEESFVEASSLRKIYPSRTAL